MRFADARTLQSAVQRGGEGDEQVLYGNGGRVDSLGECKIAPISHLMLTLSSQKGPLNAGKL